MTDQAFAGLPAPGPAQAWQARPYPQLLRGPNWRWWRPAVSVALALGVFIAAVVLLESVVVAYLVATGRTLPETISDAEFAAWTVTPAGLAVVNVGIACLTPASQLAVWVAFGWRPRWLSSVTGHLRWGWLGLCAVVSTVLFGGLMLGLSLVDGGLAVDPEPHLLALVVVVLLTTPLQAAGEEYFFRGWFAQTVGSCLAGPRAGAVLGALGSATLFAWAHGDQDLWLFVDRFGFAVLASWLVWRTGGLEAAIALHAVNNLIAFGLSLLTGQLDDMLQDTSGTPETAAVDLLVIAVTAVVIDRIARRRSIGRLFHPPVPATGATAALSPG